MIINCNYAISPQNTADFDSTKIIKAINYTNNMLIAVEPDWKDYIPRNQLRRMGKGVRIGVGAGLKLIEKNSEFKSADAIIVGTKNGGLQDCIKFLDQMIKYGDGALTPTNFVQSTTNAISGNLALATNNQSYNMTHVNGSFSFIDSLRDAEMLLQDDKKAKILIGCLEEVSDYNYRINNLTGHYKSESINSLNLLDSKTQGSICGESAVFYGISTSGLGNKIIGYDTLTSNNQQEIQNFVLQFLKQNSINKNQINTLILGYNGDYIKDEIYKSIFENNFLQSNILSFKDLFGEHPSVLSMGVWYADYLLKGFKPLNNQIRSINKKIKNVLIFNQYDTDENSIILLSKQ